MLHLTIFRMPASSSFARWRSPLFAFLAFASLLLLDTRSVRADAVDELAAALQVRSGEQVSPDADQERILAHREASIRKRIAALKTIGELRRALSLQEWNDDPTRLLDKALFRVDRKLRQEVGDRLIAAIRQVVHTGDATSKLAVANLIAEIGPDVRSTVPEEKAKIESIMGFPHQLAPEVVKLTEDKNLAVQQEALRALGNVFPNEDQALPVFKKILETGTLGPRRLAAEGLLQMVKNADFRHRKLTGNLFALRYMLGILPGAVRTSLAGINDTDPQVRQACLNVVQAAASAVGDHVPEGFKKKDFAREGRELTKEERAEIVNAQGQVTFALKDVEPQLKSFQATEAALARALKDPDSSVRLAALNSLEGIANIRLRLKRLVNTVPQVKGEEGADSREFLAANDPLRGFVKKDLALATGLLTDPNPQIRHAAVDFLEYLEADATSAIPQLSHSLSDPDRFVRWAAARAIGNISLDKADVAVPALAKLLGDLDLSIRIEAARTLTQMGARAAAAVPALARAVADGDVEGREAAMDALESVGAEAGKSAVPQLVEVMTHPDPRVRRAAAKTLGSFGSAAAAAIPTLRRALGDDDQEVRVNAGDALLSIDAARKE
ncbi:MAG: HEAT repeat domain-containing protein [Planctomycetes bacterium]|nr:HEAT repeat domain-containing protein [Planctomycetota bacterium]